jgi:hypothetical protein
LSLSGVFAKIVAKFAEINSGEEKHPPIRGILLSKAWNFLANHHIQPYNKYLQIKKGEVPS